MKKQILTFVLLFSTLGIFAQSFDGYGDRKVFLGATAQSESFGLTYFFDRAINDYLSWGMELGYSFKPKTYILPADIDRNYDGVIDENDTEEVQVDGLEKWYFALKFNGHLGSALNLDEKMDLYTGINVGKNFGAQVGGRYMFGDAVGVNLEVNVPIMANIIIPSDNTPSTNSINYNLSSNYEKFWVSFGLVFNL